MGQVWDRILGDVTHHVILTRQGGLDRPGGEVLGGDTQPQQGPGDRTRGGPDDDLHLARIETEVVLQDRQHARVIGLPDDATATEGKTDASHAPRLTARPKDGHLDVVDRPTQQDQSYVGQQW
jgi:hypothetical protein